MRVLLVACGTSYKKECTMYTVLTCACIYCRVSVYGCGNKTASPNCSKCVDTMGLIRSLVLQNPINPTLPGQGKKWPS
jgi:hypothetical protein